MNVVILAGGLGSRLSEETALKPKPMVEIGPYPILWHIMKIYTAHGLRDFIICAGYKGYVIKEYFANYFLHRSDVTFDMQSNTMEVHAKHSEPWRVTIVDTGEKTMTGGRLKRIRPYVGESAVCCTYGDGVGNVDITKLLEFHKKGGRYATMTGVLPSGRFGAVSLVGVRFSCFVVKSVGEGGVINGGFFVLEPEVFNYLDGDKCVFERKPLEQLAMDGQLDMFRHDGFWQPMDTLRDKVGLEEMWESGKAPWKIWKD